MKKRNQNGGFPAREYKQTVLAAALMLTLALSGCSQSAPASDANGKGKPVQSDSMQAGSSIPNGGSAQNGDFVQNSGSGQSDGFTQGAMDSPGSSNAQEAEERSGTEKEENGQKSSDAKADTAAMEDGNLAVLLRKTAEEAEQILGEYDGDLDRAKNVGILMYPGLDIQVWNGTGEIDSVTLLDTEQEAWNIFGIRPGDSMDEARSQLTSLGAKKEQTGSMYASDNYRLTWHEQNMHVELSDGGSGDQVDAVKVFLDANDMLGIDVSGEFGMDSGMSEELGLDMAGAEGMGGMDFPEGEDPHMAELQEKYPDALVSIDGFTKKISYEDEWLDASVYLVMDLGKGEDISFAFTPDGNMYRMDEGEWKPEK